VSEVKLNAVLIIGAGIGGMDAALDLAEAGHRVYLVEKTAAIGGNYARVYKVFPLDECSACVLTPKMNAVGKHPNITLLTLSTITKIEGVAGDFQVTIHKKPRYVDESKCTGCGRCIEACPVEVLHEYNYGLNKRKAIYLDFAQQIPFVTTIDKNNCINCRMCEKTCLAKAINHEMEEEFLNLNVGAIIISTGFEEFDPSEKLPQLGYKRHKNVITSMMYERMTHPAGLDNVVRPSDGKRIKRAVFVNCIGARDEQIGNTYCNKACCMFSMKNARNLHHHEEDAEIFISYIDIRSAGKLYELYYRSTMQDYGIKFLRGKVAEVLEDPKTRDLTVRLEDTETAEPMTIDDVDLVVLNCSFRPSEGTLEIARLLNLETEDDGFIKEYKFENGAISTSIAGIYLAGAAHGPKDGSDTIVEAKAAASAAATHLIQPEAQLEVTKSTVSDPNYVPKVGVFVCHCGGIISSVVDVKKVVEEIKKEPNVSFITDYLFMCSSPGQDLIRNNANKFNRVLVCSCSPAIHEKTFRNCVEDVGMSRFHFTGPMNIREQCAMVHKDDHEKATEKAIELIRGGIARVARLQAVPIRKIDFVNSVLIIGGGVAGLNAALDSAKRGMSVHLIEKESRLGGRLTRLYKLFPHGDLAQDILKKLFDDVEKDPNITIHLETEIEEMTGHVGNYVITLNQKGNRNTINVGGVIVSIGTKAYTPQLGEYGYGQHERVLTSLEFEEKLRNDEEINPKNVIFIQCVGSRAYPGEAGNVHCSRVCCNVSLINAEVLKEKFPTCNVHVLYKEHFRAFGRYMEEKYKALMMRGVTFTRFKKDEKPEVIVNGDKIEIKYHDSLLNKSFHEEIDYLILSVGQEAPDGIEKLCEVLGITRSQDGFVEEMHIKFRPVETKVPGVFTSASFPKDVADTINMARGAASGIHQLQKGIELEMIIAEVNEDLCVGCGLCESICAYDAITMKETSPGKWISVTDEIQCAGCGTCVASCPVGARDLRWWRDEQFLAQIEAILRE